MRTLAYGPKLILTLSDSTTFDLSNPEQMVWRMCQICWPNAARSL